MNKLKLDVSQYVLVFWFVISTAVLLFMLFGCGARQKTCPLDTSATWEMKFYFSANEAGNDCGLDGPFPFWVSSQDNGEQDTFEDTMGSDICIGSVRYGRYIEASCSGTLGNGARYVFNFNGEQVNSVVTGKGKVSLSVTNFSCEQPFNVLGTYNQ